MDDADGASDIDRGLARLDPLTVRPRISSRVLCVVFGLLLIAIGFGVWWGCVFTENGQSYDELVWKNLHNDVPSWATGVMNAVAQSWLVIAVSCTIAAIGIITALIRRRWWLAGQIAVFAVVCLAVTRIKGLLPRPFIINTESPAANSAPSGHVILAAAASVMLLCAVPRVLRALVAVIGWAYTVLVGLSVIAAQWHRPTDVIMALLIVGGLALLALATTFASGMDGPGTRVSSASVQIVGSVMLTIGVLGILYGAYIIWQIQPGLAMSAEWTNAGAYVSTALLTAAVSALVLGITLAMRQLTASPLTKLGLVGAPPAPPKR